MDNNRARTCQGRREVDQVPLSVTKATVLAVLDDPDDFHWRAVGECLSNCAVGAVRGQGVTVDVDQVKFPVTGHVANRLLGALPWAATMDGAAATQATRASADVTIFM
jgi:hypothetical protein